MAHELDDVDGDAEPAHGIEILAEAVPADTRLAADAPDPVAHLVFTSLPDGAGRETAHPDHLGGHALAHLGLGGGARLVDEVGVRVDVDEARGNHQPLGVDGPRRLAGQSGTNGRNPVTFERHVGSDARRAAAIHHGAVLDQD